MVLRKSYLDKIIPFIDQDLIKVLVGIRRCGKTVLLGQIKDVLLQRNIPAQNIIQANFESMRFRNTRTAETPYDYIAEKAEGCTGKIYILLDEIQEVERWQIAINSLGVEEDAVGLPTDSWSLTNYTVEQYEEMYQKVKDGTLAVDADYNNLEQEYSNLTLKIS